MTTTQKDRWAAKADRREAWADAAEARAAALLSNRNTDWAFISQPGHIPARAREIAQTDRAMELLAKANSHRAKAANLSTLATREKGDAEAARQAKRDALEIVAGDVVSSLYGNLVVLKVNAKSLRLQGRGMPLTVDKAHCKKVAQCTSM